MKIGYQGIPGSYSEMTVQDYLRDQGRTLSQDQVLPYNNFASLVDDLLADRLQEIVIPVENSTTGSITRVTNLLRYQPIHAIAQAYQTVDHHLLGLAGADLSDIKEIYSHPEALAQCANFFAQNPQFHERSFSDTADAARFISQEGNKSLAALASVRAGEIYGLQDFQMDVLDEHSNTTRFYVVKKQSHVQELSGRQISLYLEAKHRAGSLLNILQVLQLFEINMTTLNSQPIPNKPFQYGFWIEGIGKSVVEELDQLLAMLEKVAEYVQLIGIFQPLDIKKGK